MSKLDFGESHVKLELYSSTFYIAILIVLELAIKTVESRWYANAICANTALAAPLSLAGTSYSSEMLLYCRYAGFAVESSS